MKVWISDAQSSIVTCLALEEREAGDCEIICLEGEMPAGLTIADLMGLGIVKYEPDTRGRPIPKVCPITPSENLEYLRALIEAMPPGFFVSKVESEKIDQMRAEKVERFEQELERIQNEDA